MKKFLSFLMSILILISLFEVKLAIASSGDTTVTPTPTKKITGNFPNITGHLEFKIESLESRTYKLPGTDKIISVTFNNKNSTIDFKSELPIFHVFVKGGNGGYIYDFDTPTDVNKTYVNLHPLEYKSGYKTISHVVFYYDPPQPSKGQVNVIKSINSFEGELQANVKFDLYKIEPNKEPALINNGTRLTNEKGQILYDNLDEGTYKLVETVPDGFLQTDMKVSDGSVVKYEKGEKPYIIFKVFIGKCTDIYVVNSQVHNEEFGKIKINKYKITPPSKDEEPQAGVTFKVEPIFADSENNPFTLLTDENGTADSGSLPVGKYRITEESCEGYPVDFYNTNFQLFDFNGNIIAQASNTQTFEVEVKAGQYVFVKAVNILKPGTIEVDKVMTNSETEETKPHVGVKFKLYPVVSATELNGAYEEDKPIAEGITKLEPNKPYGTLYFTSIPSGHYRLVEEVPEGFTSLLATDDKNCSKEITFSLEPTEHQVVKVTNFFDPASVTVTKTMRKAWLNELEPQEVTFNLKKLNIETNKYEPFLVGKTKKVNTIAELTFKNLEPGKYELEEVVPNDFTSNNPIQQFELKAGEDKVLRVVNTCNLSAVKIIKTYKTSEGDEGVLKAGVAFKLYQNNEVIREGTTNEKGELLFTELPSGTYELEEIVPDDCTSSLNGKLKIELPVNTVKTINVTNTLKPASVTIIKSMFKAWLEGSQPQEVTFKLKRLNSDGNCEQLLIDTTKIDGDIALLKFKDLLPGKYELEEVVPNNFTSNNPIQQFELKAGEDKVLRVVNTCNLSAVKIIKTYKTSEGDEGVLKAGVAFKLYQNNEVIREGTTNEKGELLFTELPSGPYELEEIVPDDCTSSLNGKLKIQLAANTVKTISVINTKNNTVPVINPTPDPTPTPTQTTAQTINKIPKTGGRVDFEGMLAMGILCFIAGVYIVYKKI